MKRALTLATLIAGASFFASCYHARIETGLMPSAQIVEKTFAASWIYGLVPPSMVKAATECHNGVAVVETELSFLNQLVGLLTLGIYTPMHIKVTCAESSDMGSLDNYERELIVHREASEQEMIKVFALAADRAVTKNQAVFVRIE